MYILDTDILIYFFKGMGRVASKLLSVPPGEIGIPSIVLYELRTGIAKSNNPKKRLAQLMEVVSLTEILPFGEKEAESAADVRADLEIRGMPVGPYDILIAGTALARNAVLVTHNYGEFERIHGLKVTDWY